MVMLASIAATKCEQPIEMDGIEAIDKSWPEYLKVYQMLEESANEQRFRQYLKLSILARVTAKRSV